MKKSIREAVKPRENVRGCPPKPVEHGTVITLSGGETESKEQRCDTRDEIFVGACPDWDTLLTGLPSSLPSYGWDSPGASLVMKYLWRAEPPELCHIWMKFPFGCGRKLESTFQMICLEYRKQHDILISVYLFHRMPMLFIGNYCILDTLFQ